ncbi:immunoglobulin lambda-1 light chain-like [Strix uralensis]|uniref:immunoglobulin lambda-1 light chain-like n=1 Tax=Strix uralensis TaxID=36305 RepID=UPI003DA72784
MTYGLLGTLLLLLPGAASAEGRWVQQRQRQLWVRPGETAELSCHTSHASNSVFWYKEKPDGVLYWIYRSPEFSFTKEKYLGRKKTQWIFSLSISPVQREDSGVYYCSSSDFFPLFGNGTRLIVTNATEPELSILVPVDAEQPPADIPLLCHLRDLPRGWDTVRWQPGGKVTPVTASAVDEHGVLSAWSITWVPAEHWDGAATCTALESGTGRNLSVTIGKGLGEGQCPSWPLALGLPCVSLLFLLQLILLLCRRRLARDGSTPVRR